MLEPDTRMPVAIPRRRVVNQAEAKARMGTLDPALPAPTKVRITKANSKESEKPVKIMPKPTRTREMKIILRGPRRVAKYPPIKAKDMYPIKLPVPIQP